MRRGPKPVKANGEAKRPVTRKSAKDNDARVPDLEKPLAEARERERAISQILRVNAPPRWSSRHEPGRS